MSNSAHSITKRLTCILLSGAMALSPMPSPALAEVLEEAETLAYEGEGAWGDASADDGLLAVEGPAANGEAGDSFDMKELEGEAADTSPGEEKSFTEPDSLGPREGEELEGEPAAEAQDGLDADLAEAVCGSAEAIELAAERRDDLGAEDDSARLVATLYDAALANLATRDLEEGEAGQGQGFAIELRSAEDAAQAYRQLVGEDAGETGDFAQLRVLLSERLDGEGIADAFARVAHELGVECVTVQGDDGSAWAMVRLGEAWYHADVVSALRDEQATAESGEQSKEGWQRDVTRRWLLVSDDTMLEQKPECHEWATVDDGETPAADRDYGWKSTEVTQAVDGESGGGSGKHVGEPAVNESPDGVDPTDGEEEEHDNSDSELQALASTTASGTCGDNLTWKLSNGKLTISGSGAMTSHPWTDYAGEIISVSLPKGITEIGDYAFSGCSSLASLEIPEGVTSLGEHIIAGTKVSSIVVPASVTRGSGESGYSATFDGADALESVTLASGMKRVPDNLLAGSSVRTVSIPPTVTEIGTSAFSGCASLSSVSLPSGLESIGDRAFSGCSSLMSLEIPEGVTSLGRRIIAASGVSSIVVPASITRVNGYMDDAPFAHAPALESVTLARGMKRIPNNLLACSSVKSVSIPSTVTEIGFSAFQYCSSLASVSIPSTVTRIEFSAFQYCSSLVSVSLPSGLEYIADLTFQCCSSLASVSLPSGLESIGNRAFQGCSSLTSLEIPEGVTSLGEHIIAGTKVSSIVVPASVTRGSGESGYSATFNGADALESVTLASGMKRVPDNLLAGSSVRTVSIPSTVTEIGTRAFQDSSSLEKVSIAKWSRLKRIGSYAFSGCSSLTDIYFGNTQERWDKVDRVDCGLGSLPKALIHVEGGRRPYDMVLDSISFTHSNGKTGSNFANSSYVRGKDPLYKNKLWTEGEIGFWCIDDYTHINDSDRATLTKNLCLFDRNKVLRNQEKQTWGGNCFGLSMAMALAFCGDDTVLSRSTQSPGSFADVEAPWTNTSILSILTAYQMSQFFSPPTSVYRPGGGGDALDKTLGDLVTALKKDGVAVISVSRVNTRSGHTLVASNLRGKPTGGYTCSIYDVNSGGSFYLNETSDGAGEQFAINDDELTMSFDYGGVGQPSFSIVQSVDKRLAFANGTEATALTEEQGILEVYSVDTLRTYMSPDTRFQSFDRLIFKSDARGVSYKEGGKTTSLSQTVSGNASNGVIDDYIVSDGDGAGWRVVTVEDADEYQIESDGGEIVLTVSSPKELYSVLASNSSIVRVIKGEGITALGEDQTFEMTVGEADGGGQLYTLEGGSTGEVVAKIEEDGSLSIETDGVLSDVSVALLNEDGNEKETIEIEDGAGKVTVSENGEVRTEQPQSDKKNLDGCEVDVVDQTYTGKAVEPKATVRLGGIALKEGIDYTLSYRDNVKVGMATVVVTGSGIYTGSKEVTFRIVDRFPDVKPGSWYYKVVNRAADLGLVTGYANGNFGPDDNITRGQVAVILWRMAGQPKAGSSAKSFSDVTKGKYYYDAVRWASGAGVVSGYASGKFGPNDKVTREQLAVMLANYAKKVGGLEVTGSRADFSSMKDASKVAGYAQPAVGWCFRNKILSGSQGNVLPKGNATRAQAAKMLVFLHDMLN